MFTRSGTAGLAIIPVGVWATLTACSAIVLMTAGCGISVSSNDFPAFALSEPVPDAAAPAPKR